MSTGKEECVLFFFLVWLKGIFKRYRYWGERESSTPREGMSRGAVQQSSVLTLTDSRTHVGEDFKQRLYGVGQAFGGRTKPRRYTGYLPSLASGWIHRLTLVLKRKEERIQRIQSWVFWRDFWPQNSIFTMCVCEGEILEWIIERIWCFQTKLDFKKVCYLGTRSLTTK